MVRQGDDVFGQMLHQLLFHGERSCALFASKSQAVAHPEYVRVHGHACLLEDDGLDDVCRLASHARQFLQFLASGRYDAPVIPDEHLRHAHKVLCLVVGVGHTPYIFIYNVGSCLCHGLGGGVVAEERRGYLVDAFVRALCAEYDGNQQFKGRAVVQFLFRHGHRLLEVTYQEVVSVLSFHGIGN